MKIIVTGALGHIGSALIRELPKYYPDTEIVLIDSMLTQRFCSLFDLPATGRYRFIQGDIIEMDLDDIFEAKDVVINLSAMTDAEGSKGNAAAVENNNFNCTYKIAEACANKGLKLITLSSTSVYGSQNQEVSEDCHIDDLNPQSPYAETKLKEEALVKSLSSNNGFQSVILRFGTIYGVSPGMRFHTAVNKFCWQSVMGQPLTVWETAYTQKRPYLHLNDAIKALSFFINHQVNSGEIYNVLTGNHTVKDVVDQIKKFVDDVEVTFVKSAIMNQLSYEVSRGKVEKLGFEFTGSLEQGIGDTIKLLANARTRNR